ncbi:MBL fold metallo-hydrolase [Methanobacterium formicicum]|uniref:MBL fold metallo-hydrolase n=1 Tax=Methanobacterium formicicum TaxID=2162 RepID=UPI00248FD9B6|nr:MBL fold metallo-hydrolase [Methanobacterium formicicum]
MERWLTPGGCTVYPITKGRSNTYLVFDGDDSILVDTSHRGALKGLTDKLDDLLDGRKLSWLVLTHSHYDHAENTAVLKERYNTRVIVHKSELYDLKQGFSPLPTGTNPITRIVSNLGGKISSFSHYESVGPDIIVDDAYPVTPRTYLIHTPGHTEGSMSLIVDDEIALVGDAMFGVFNWSVFPHLRMMFLLSKKAGENLQKLVVKCIYLVMELKTVENYF